MQRFKNLIINLVLAGLIIFGAYQALYLFVLRPKLHIAGDVRSVSIYHGEAKVRESTTARDFRLGPGTYTAKVVTGDGEVSRTFKLGLLKNNEFDVRASGNALGSSELVSNSSGLEATLQNGQLTYLDTVSGSFTSLSKDAVVTGLLPPPGAENGGSPNRVTQVSPLPNGEELLVTGDSVPYVWKDGAVRPLSLAGIDTSSLDQRQLLFGSNATNDSFVMSVGQTVYYYASPESDPINVADIKTRFNRLIYGGGSFLAFDTTLPYTASDLKPSYSQKYLVYPTLANAKTHSSFQLSQPLVDASLSPNGTYLITKFRQEEDAKLYKLNASSASLVASVTRPDSLAPLWTSNKSFVYAAVGAIWSYDTNTGISTSLVDNLTMPPSSISLQADGSVTYTSLSKAGAGAIYRITQTPGLSNAAAKNLVRALYDKPFGTADYTWTYADIARPTFMLSLTYPPGGGNPTEAQASQNFRDRLSAAGLDPKLFTVTAHY